MSFKKTMLLAGVAVLFTSNAMARDLTGAFSVPAEGEFLSETRFGYERYKDKDGHVDEGYKAMEILEYGVTDKFSIVAGIDNQFDTQGELNNDHNFSYMIGAKYTTKKDKWSFQFGGEYYTYEANEFGVELADTYAKNIVARTKIGYDLDNGWSPYAIYEIDSEFDKSDREMDQSLSLGAHKYNGNNAFDVAVRYDFATDREKYDDEWWLDVAYDHYVKENVAVGVYGSYYLDGKDDKDVDYSYDAGVRLTVLF